MHYPRIILGITSLILTSAYELSPHGVIINVSADNSIVELAVEGLTSFRVSVSYMGVPIANESPMIDNQNKYAAFTVTHNGSMVGIKTSFGEIRLDSQTGAFSMVNAKGGNISSTHKLSEKVSTVSLPRDGKPQDDTCLNFVQGNDISSGSRTPGCPNGLANQTQKSCCTACNNDKDCTVWIYATDGGSEGKNCWLMYQVHSIRPADGRVVGGALPEVSMSIKLSLGRSPKAQFYGRGCDMSDSTTFPRKSSQPKVGNTAFNTPYYYSSDGYSALGVSSHLFNPGSFGSYPAPWALDDRSGTVVWTILGHSVDLYLIPASTQAEGLSGYWDLTGRPAVLPRYAYGFMACRWGWENDKYILDMLTRFRNGSFPIDAFISDFEWYTPTPDYNLPDAGASNFQDFSFNNKTFPNPTDQLKLYRDQLNMRFGGIRKPRLGNSDSLVMAKTKGWLVSQTKGFIARDGVNGRNINYTRDDVREWYAKQQEHYYDDGVQFFWNDEGESFYFLYYYWNLAQQQSQMSHDLKKRFFSINRAYTPGMQRVGTTIWTGDVHSSWDVLQKHPGYVLNWGLAGAQHVTCDTGGFNGNTPSPLLLTRWYQFAVFMPVMRVHSTRGQTPHFPFLYGPEAAIALRLALNLRYRLIPYHYSIAHQGYESGGKLMMRPLMWYYSNDSTAVGLTKQWMDGDYLMPAPVLNQDNSSSVYLPLGKWYEFNTTTVLKGPQTLHLTNVPLNHIPVYAKAGGIIPLAPVNQYTAQLPGGPLEVQIYPGEDGSFTMFEDDGESKDYQKGVSKKIHFSWDDKSKTLSWTTDGSFKDDHTFTQIRAVAFFAEGEKHSSVQPLGGTGKIIL